MSNSIYTPYTYLIGWSKLNKFYYGVRTAKNCNPNDFWVTYFTSSKQVKRMIKQYGNPDIIQIRKRFKNKEDALLWESKVLRRLNVKNRNDFLNLCETYSDFNTTGHIPVINLQTNEIEYVTCEEYEKEKEILYRHLMKNKITVVDINTNEYITISTDEYENGKDVLYKHPLRNVTISDKKRLKLSECNKGKNNSQYGKYGKDHPAYGYKYSEKQLKDRSESVKGEKNPQFGKKHSIDFKQKMSIAHRGENNHQFGKIAVINIITGQKENITCEEYKKNKNILYRHYCIGKKASEETKRKLSESAKQRNSKNKIWIVNPNNETKFILSNEFENYSNRGFIKGRKYVN